MEPHPDVQLRLMYVAGFRPHNLGLYQDKLVEFISWPFYENDQFGIMIRTEIGDATTMIRVETKEVLTARQLLHRLTSGYKAEDHADLLRMVKAFAETSFVK